MSCCRSSIRRNKSKAGRRRHCFPYLPHTVLQPPPPPLFSSVPGSSRPPSHDKDTPTERHQKPTLCLSATHAVQMAQEPRTPVTTRPSFLRTARASKCSCSCRRRRRPGQNRMRGTLLQSAPCRVAHLPRSTGCTFHLAPSSRAAANDHAANPMPPASRSEPQGTFKRGAVAQFPQCPLSS